MSQTTLVWDSSDTGPIYVENNLVEYAKLEWDERKEKPTIIKTLRENGLSLREAAYVLKMLETNYPRTS